MRREVGHSQALKGARQWLSKRWFLPKNTMVIGAACANHQVFMLRVVSCVRRETTVENYFTSKAVYIRWTGRE